MYHLYGSPNNFEIIADMKNRASGAWGAIAWAWVAGYIFLLLLLYIADTSRLNWQLVLEFTKILLSAPPIALLTIVLLVTFFHEPIRGFINRLKNVKGGGVEFEAAPAQESAPIEGEDLMHFRVSVPVKSGNPAAALGAGAAEKPRPPGQETEANKTQEKIPPELANAEGEKLIEYVKSQPIRAALQGKQLWNNFRAERMFNSIYGTQLNLLLALESRGETPTEMREIAQYHTEHLRLAQPHKYPKEAYLKFLLDFGAIVPADAPPLRGGRRRTGYVITDFGRFFMQYIRQNYAATWFSRPY